MRQQGGEEAEETAGGRSADGHGGGLSVLRETFGDSVRVKVPWDYLYVFG